MLREMGSRSQILDWQMFDELEPIGDIRGDYQAASIVGMLANLHRNTEKFPKAFANSLFLLPFGGAPEEATEAPKPKKKDWRQLKAIAQSLAAMYNEEERKKNLRMKRRQRG